MPPIPFSAGHFPKYLFRLSRRTSEISLKGIELLPRNTHFSRSRIKVQCWKINWSIIVRIWRVFCYSQFEKWMKDQELDFSPVTSRRSSLEWDVVGLDQADESATVCGTFPFLFSYTGEWWKMMQKRGQQDEDDCTWKFCLNKEQLIALCR